MVATCTYWERFCNLTLRPKRRLVFLDSPSVGRDSVLCSWEQGREWASQVVQW